MTARPRSAPLAVLLLLASTLVAPSTTAAYPAPWPTDDAIGGAGRWTPLTRNGAAWLDPAGVDDESVATLPSGPSDLVGGAWYSFDSLNQVLFVRVRLDAEPLAAGVGKDGIGDAASAGAGPFVPTQWHLTLDLQGDGYQDFDLQLAGSTGGGNTSDITTQANSIGFTAFGTTPHPGDDLLVFFHAVAPDSQLVSAHTVASGQLTALGELVFAAEAIDQAVAGDGLTGTAVTNGFHWDMGTTQVASWSGDPTWGTAWTLDLQVPLSAMTDAAGLERVQPWRPIGIALSTGSSLVDPYAKDLSWDGCFSPTPSAPVLFADNLIPGVGMSPSPAIVDVDVPACGGDVTLRASVLDALDSSDCLAARDTIASVRFDAWDPTGETWEVVGTDTDGADGGAAFNSWTADFSEPTDGATRLFRITATDDQGLTSGAVVAYRFDHAGSACEWVPTLATYADLAWTQLADAFAADDLVRFRALKLQPETGYELALYGADGTLSETISLTAAYDGQWAGSASTAAGASLGLRHAVLYAGGATPPPTHVPSDGTAIANAVYRVPGCGDGRLDAGEACDDGNLAPSDGCDPACSIEPPEEEGPQSCNCQGAPTGSLAWPLFAAGLLLPLRRRRPRAG